MVDKKKQSFRQEKTSKWRKFAKRRWVYPAVYLGFAALVLTTVLWMQNDTDNYTAPETDQHPTNEDSFASEDSEDVTLVNQSNEFLEWPVNDKNSVKVQKQFYDQEASKEDKQAALVFHNNTFRPNLGINIARENGKTFAVTAAMSGTVVDAGKDSLYGNYVKIKHNEKVTTFYQSLDNVAVAKGDVIQQGQKLGMAGRSEFYKKAEVHTHFEVRVNGKPVNPVGVFGKSLGSLKEPTKTDDHTDNNNASEQNTQNQTEEKNTSDESSTNETTNDESSANETEEKNNNDSTKTIDQ